MSISPVNGIGYNTTIRQAKVLNNQSFKGSENEESQGMSKTGKVLTAIGIVGVAALAAFGVCKHRSAKDVAQATETVQQAVKNIEHKNGNFKKLAGEVSESMKKLFKSSKKVANKDLKKGKDGLYLLKGKAYTGVTIGKTKVNGKNVSTMNEYANGLLQRSFNLKGKGDKQVVKVLTFDKEGKVASTVLCSKKAFYKHDILADGKEVVTKALNPANVTIKGNAKKAKNEVWTSAGLVTLKKGKKA